MADKMIRIWTDGACAPNPGPGAWAALLVYGAHHKVLTGYVEETTNSRMELTAPIEGLKALKRTQLPVVVTVDSRYVLDGITKFAHGWSKNGWVNSEGKPVANQDLWQALMAQTTWLDITWRWVKAHERDDTNNRVDALAREALKRKEALSACQEAERASNLPDAKNCTTDGQRTQGKWHIEAIKAKHPIARFVAPYCGGLRSSGQRFLKGYCPFCQSARQGSRYRFWVCIDLGICGCHKPACRDQQPGGKPMDVINFYARVKGISNLEAIRELL